MKTVTEDTPRAIPPEVILLDIISRWPATEPVFRRYDEQAGENLAVSDLVKR